MGKLNMIAELKPYPAMKDSEVEGLGEVPELLKNRFVYKEPRSNLEALHEIVRALPIRPGPIVWR